MTIDFVDCERYDIISLIWLFCSIYPCHISKYPLRYYIISHISIWDIISDIYIKDILSLTSLTVT